MRPEWRAVARPKNHELQQRGERAITWVGRLLAGAWEARASSQPTKCTRSASKLAAYERQRERERGGVLQQLQAFSISASFSAAFSQAVVAVAIWSTRVLSSRFR